MVKIANHSKQWGTPNLPNTAGPSQLCVGAAPKRILGHQGGATQNVLRGRPGTQFTGSSDVYRSGHPQLKSVFATYLLLALGILCPFLQ